MSCAFGVFGRAIVRLCFIFALLLAAPVVRAQDFAELVDRPISSIRIEGLERVSEQQVRNELRAAVGDPFDPQVVRDDLRRINRLGEFKPGTGVRVVEQPDGTVAITYTLEEQAIIREISVVGNKLISNEELLAVVRQFAGGPRDDYLIQNARRAMEELYRERGHYLATVTIDQQLLEEQGILIFQVIEGPRVRVRAVEFEGNAAFDADRLRAEVETKSAIPFIRKGALDEEVLSTDVAAIDAFYKARGYLDVRVDRRIELSPDSREVKVTFIIVEGRQYLLRSVKAVARGGEGELKVYAPEQIAAMLAISPGDVYSAELIRESVEIVRQAYEVLGYLPELAPPRVRPYELRSAEAGAVDLVLEIDEGVRSKVGLVRITGNTLTRDKVIRREVRLRPGRIFDGTEIDKAEQRILETRHFNDVRITIQDPDQVDPAYRDVLIEVKERNTGAINFGLAVGSDSGVFGELSLSQTNFDIADPPESFSELVRGAAFRGAGQRFNAVLRPGSEFFQYSMGIVEPHLFESDIALSVAGAYRDRRFEDYDEERLTGTVGLSRRLGDVWEIGLRSRAERIELSEIEPEAPTEVFRDEGPDNLTALGVTLTRTTVGTVTRPGRGSRLELSFDRVGALGGEFDYNVVSGEYTIFLTLDRDFLGRRTTLRLNTRAGYIFGGGRAPTYERFYLGGRSLRGFEFRTISPKGIRADNGLPGDDPIGGNWLFFAGAQYEFPLFEEALSGVLFIDTGTVLDGVGLDDYRVAIGAGLRLSIPQLGPVPIAIDFGFPIIDVEGDESQLFSFSAELPF